MREKGQGRVGDGRQDRQVDLSWRMRGWNESTSALHQVTLCAKSCLACCTIGAGRVPAEAPSAKAAPTSGMAQLLDGQFVQSLSQYRLLNPMRSRRHHLDRGGSGGGGISPLIDAVVVSCIHWQQQSSCHKSRVPLSSKNKSSAKWSHECLSILFITSITRGIKAET